VDETLPSLGGTFRYPFAFGYSCVGQVLASEADEVPAGSVVFAFHPHQDLFTAGSEDIVTLDAVDDRTATILPLVETALQVSLDAGPRLGERVVVLGLGPVGILSAALLLRAGAEVVGVDPRADRRDVAAGFGVPAVDRAEIRALVDDTTSGAGVPLVVEATGSPAALTDALELLAHEGEALVCSWYGMNEARLPLGGPFHRRRLAIRSTQVSTIPARLAGRWTVARRRSTAVRLMDDLPLKLLATHEVPFDRPHEAYEMLDRGDVDVMHVALRY
jgi:threonine dehydrogenase-like Zn-dependent dehydrogenase